MCVPKRELGNEAFEGLASISMERVARESAGAQKTPRI
jgi:hypothetical protein